MPSPLELPIEITSLVRDFGQIILGSAYLWLPVALAMAFLKLWYDYIRLAKTKKTEWVLLEIKLPRDIFKSPQAMEIFLTMLHQDKGYDWYEVWFHGDQRAWFSLEIVGIGGEIHLYIYTTKFYRNLVEAQIYAQFPDAEVFEREDYTKSVTETLGEDLEMWGADFVLVKESAYPIKTYIDYGLDKTATKEEQKSDPFTAMMEFLGSLRPGACVWLQILIRAKSAPESKEWRKEATKIIEDMVKSKEKTSKDGLTISGAFALTPGDRVVMEAVERNVSKLAFDVGMRGIYLDQKSKFNKVNVASLNAAIKQFSSLHLNGFKPTNTTSKEYSWDPIFGNKFKNRRELAKKRALFDAYCQRAYFYAPYAKNYYILNTEALATMFHFPGRVSETPNLARIEAKKSEAPINLPI